MPRELYGHRELFSYLAEKYPLMVSKSEAAKILEMSVETLRRLAVKGEIKVKDTQVALWEIARYMCK